jgi:hypothetical protein
LLDRRRRRRTDEEEEEEEEGADCVANSLTLFAWIGSLPCPWSRQA